MNEAIKTEDGSFTLHSERYGQTYHSTHGALTEAHHVFLDASGVSERLGNGSKTRVLEIGFGLGLNALLTADLAAKHLATLEYHAFEHDLIPAESATALNYQSLLQHEDIAESMRKVFTSAPRYGDSQSYKLHGEDIRLLLHVLDATTTNIAQQCGSGFHAIYLDAFSPDSNAECWSLEFITRLVEVMASNAKLSTYSAKGAVRRALEAAGLTVRKLPGPPGKREMLVGQKP